MKLVKLLLKLGFIVAAPLCAQTTTYTGTIKDLTGTPVTAGQIGFNLQPGTDSTIPGIGRFIPTTVYCLINASGSPVAISDGVSPCVVVNNTSLSPSGTYYKITIYPNFAGPGSTINGYAIGGTVDITTLVPTPATSPAYGMAGQGLITTFAGLQAAITACASTPCTLNIGSTIIPSANFTIPSNAVVQFYVGGQLQPSAGVVVTILGSVVAPSSQIFSGAGTVSLSGRPAVEWFGAAGDWNGTTGTDNTIAIQACLNALTNGQCMLLAKSYKTTSPLSITKSNVGIGGVVYAITSNTIYPTPSPSKIIVASASADGIDLSGVSTGNNVIYNRFTNFTIDRTVAPISTARGLSMFFSYGAIVEGVTVEDSAVGFYLHGVGSQGTGHFENCAVTWGYNGFTYSGLNLAGFEVDSIDGTASNSLRLRHDFVVNNPPNTGNVTYGMQAAGASTHDLFLDDFETAALNYGNWITSSSAVFTASSDIHIINSINDDCLTSCILVSGISGTVEIAGGWSFRNTASLPVIDIENSSHVEVSNQQIYFPSGTGAGILANNSGGIRIVGNDVIGVGPSAVSFNNTAASVISGNVFNGCTCTSIISLTGSVGNTVSGNSLQGTATNGIFIDAASAGIGGLETNTIGNPSLGVITNLINDANKNGTTVVEALKVGLAGSTINTILTGSATLTYTAIAAGTQQTQTLVITGALAANKGVTCVPQATLSSTNLIWNAFVLSANTVSVQITNIGGSPATPAAVAWGCSVIQ